MTDIDEALRAPPTGWVAALVMSVISPETRAWTVNPPGVAPGLQARPLLLAHAEPLSVSLLAHDGEITVIFDGLLVNRDELTRVSDICSASDLTDPSLVLNLYRQWGEQLLPRLRGSYIVIIWDGGRNLLFAARDSMGSVPLFYVRVDATLLLSTSIDALLCQPGVDKTLNRVALAETLAHRYPAPEETYYLGIRRVPQGHALRQRTGSDETVQYWEPAPPDTPDDSMRAEDLAPFDKLLRQAVARALIPSSSGIFLSGGLDSVSAAAMAADIGHSTGTSLPLALSLAFPDPECDEAAVQSGVAAGLGLKQILLPFDEAVGAQGLLAAALALSATLAAPLQNPWRPAYYTLADKGREAGCRVVLTGVGGDDWLTVNSNYMADLLNHADLIGSYRFLRNMLRSYTLPRAAMIRFLLWRAGLRPVLASRARAVLTRIAPRRLHTWRSSRLLRAQTMAAWLAPDPAIREAMEERVAQQVEATLHRPEPRGRYGFYSATSISRTFAHPLLSLEQEEDYAIGRRLGLRLAHPYWDPDLVSFLCRVPPRLLLAGGREKGLVRQAVARRFPDLAFAYQRKVSASNFFYTNLRTQAPAARRRLGALVGLGELGLVDANRIDAFMSDCLASGDSRRQHVVWELLTLEAWVRPRL